MPRPVAGNWRFVAISAGDRHTCALTAPGKAYCWGASSVGALGRDSTRLSGEPIAVDGGLTFKTISAGFDFSCGVTTAGAAYCWGWNVVGELGRDTTSTWTPVPVAGGHVFTTIVAGRELACGLVTGGTAYCWGQNDLGSLGIGDGGSPTTHPAPELVMGGLHFRSIAVGSANVCAVTVGGSAYCWGNNSFGQLGADSLILSAVPTPVLTNILFDSIAVSPTHACGVSEIGDLYCWGSNRWAQFAGPVPAGGVCGGLSNYPCARRPVPAADGRIFRSVTTGSEHTCAIERNGGGAFCWGANDQGQLGLGFASDSVAAPSHIPDP